MYLKIGSCEECWLLLFIDKEAKMIYIDSLTTALSKNQNRKVGLLVNPRKDKDLGIVYKYLQPFIRNKLKLCRFRLRHNQEYSMMDVLANTSNIQMKIRKNELLFRGKSIKKSIFIDSVFTSIKTKHEQKERAVIVLEYLLSTRYEDYLTIISMLDSVKRKLLNKYSKKE